MIEASSATRSGGGFVTSSVLGAISRSLF
jgi:hypothetical protein